MYGAIIGDIIGSRFEFDNGNKSKEFELFTSECDFTDDTVMTIAIAEGLLDVGPDADEKTVKESIIRSMKKWGKKYPYAGYGQRFIGWVLSDNSEPYGSYGNGSGMRVAAVGWLYDTIERTREIARWTAEVTHNHPEGIKGAESTASAIFMARNGASMDDIKKYVVDEFGYDLSRTLEEIRPNYHHVEDCMHTMPEAFECFLESESYEDCIRNVMYIGGDTDTLGAIAGAIAEAFWGLPVSIVKHTQDYLPKEMFMVINRFQEAIQPKLPDDVDDYSFNKFIKEYIGEYKNGDDKARVRLLVSLVMRIYENGQAPTPMEDNNENGELDPDTIVAGNQSALDTDFNLRIHVVTDEAGKRWIPFFTDEDELFKEETTSVIMNMPIGIIFEDGLFIEDVEGVVINPFGDALYLDKEKCEAILKQAEEVRDMREHRDDQSQ